MQRLGGNFLVNRVVMLHIGNGNISELYELPNGQWQFGKNRDATVIQRLDQVFKLPPQSRWVDAEDWGKGYLTAIGKDAHDQIMEEFHPFGELGDVNVLRSIEAWLVKVMTRTHAPVPMQAGVQGNVESETPHARAHRRIDHLSPEVVARLLLAVENTLGPIDDSINQAGPANHYSESFGDPENPPPGDTTVSAFQLPVGAEWNDPRNPAAGYYTFDSNIVDDRGQRTKHWHPTPEFHQMVSRPEMGSSLDAIPPKVHDPVQEEIDNEQRKHPALAGSRRTSRAKR